MEPHLRFTNPATGTLCRAGGFVVCAGLFITGLLAHPRQASAQSPALWASPHSQPDGRDSLRVHIEAGVMTEVTNEQFYEDAYQDTTFLGRRLQGTPETSRAAVYLADVSGFFAHGRREYHLQQEVTLGDKLVRVAANGTIRLRPTNDWRLSLEPTLEGGRDRSFGLDRRELRAGVTGRARYALLDPANALELVSNADFLRTGGASDTYLLGHNNARTSLAWDHSPLDGLEWRLQTETDVRTFPDSASRSHWEQHLEASVRKDLAGGHSITAGVESQRRHTLHDAYSSRDRYWTHRANLDGVLRLGSSWTLHANSEAELFRYQTPDSTLDFDYELAHAQLSLRREMGLTWAAAAGPRYEQLTTTWDPTERYREISGVIELERIDAGGWWSVTPAAGWRGYERSSTNVSLSSSAIHSSYAFYALSLFADQAVPAGLRIRLLADGRLEKHQDPSQDSRSLYFSVDVRRLF